jgi:hypothetical protein
MIMRTSSSVVGALAILAGCATALPKAELDRCERGAADDNDTLPMRQGAACRVLAQRLAGANPTAAVGYARKACQLQDAPGCEEYLALVREHSSLPGDELQSARASGEEACAGMVIAEDGADARPRICARTAALYVDLAPRSPRDAGRLYARACALGDEESCDRAKSLGVDVEVRPVAVVARAAPSTTAAPTPLPAAPLPPVALCHPMRACVALDVQQHNASEVLGTLTNHCERAVFCSFCPARAGNADKSACRTTKLAPNESKSGRDAGLWYDGYTGIAYDCADAADDRSCSP